MPSSHRQWFFTQGISLGLEQNTYSEKGSGEREVKKRKGGKDPDHGHLKAMVRSLDSKLRVG